jgi:DNA-binding transcriptional LysR family regulator
MGTVDLNDLGVFVAVAETESFSAAASRLRLPKSSVSRAIARLEGSMGMPMLHRSTRRVTVSSAGRALYEKVRGEIASLRESVAEVPELAEEPSGRLRITAVADASEFLADLVAGFVSRYRSVEVDLRLTNDYVNIIAEGIDLALRFSTKRLQDSSMTARKLSGSPMHLFASPSYLAREGTPRTPEQLDRHEWVVYRRATRVPLRSGSRTAVVDSRGRVTCDDMSFLRAALVNGLGIGFLPPVFAQGEVAAGKLVRVLPVWSSPMSDLWAVWPGGRQVPRKVSAFLDFMSEALKARPLG